MAKHSATYEKKVRIINLYAMGFSIEKIQNKISYNENYVTENYINKVVDEYNNDGTITVNSRLNRL